MWKSSFSPGKTETLDGYAPVVLLTSPFTELSTPLLLSGSNAAEGSGACRAMLPAPGRQAPVSDRTDRKTKQAM
ncbi:MAG TPA: hypothetical protein PKE20_08210 [Promineifilum sp.]|nr:hypothetical protein [Promineifilum sp.]